jgi:hypothetical protein
MLVAYLFATRGSSRLDLLAECDDELGQSARATGCLSYLVIGGSDGCRPAAEELCGPLPVAGLEAAECLQAACTLEFANRPCKTDVTEEDFAADVQEIAEERAHTPGLFLIKHVYATQS